MSQQMPAIDLNKLESILNPSDFALVKAIVATRGKNKGCLRAAKPDVERVDIGPRRSSPTVESGSAAFLWRWVALAISPLPQHHCMPVCADFDLPDPVLMGGPPEQN